MHKEDNQKKESRVRACYLLVRLNIFFFFISNKSQDDTSLARFHAPLVIIAFLYFQRATLAFTLSLSLSLHSSPNQKKKEKRRDKKKNI